MSESGEAISDETTTCCIVGGGPAGMVLAYLLARHGVDVTLLESHGDFDRDFRGDTFHASSLDLMDALGLGDKVQEIMHARIPDVGFTRTDGTTLTLGSFRHMGGAHPYVGVIPQSQFLDMLASEAQAFPSFRLKFKHAADGLIEEDGVVRGVRYRHGQEHGEIHADLVVAADGRGSRLRKAAGIELVASAPPMDVVWFRLSKKPSDEALGVDIFLGTGDMLVVVDRGDCWQLGYIIIKGSLKQLRDAGLDAMQAKVRELAPDFMKDRVATDLDEWKKVAVLAVQIGRVECWHKPGLLLIGDAAHVMSPIGGVGINYAIQDGVAAFNHLAEPLKQGCLRQAHLAAVQSRREWPVQFIQNLQGMLQKKIIQQALASDKPFQMPFFTRVISAVPGLNRLPARLMAYGVRPDSLPHALPVE